MKLATVNMQGAERFGVVDGESFIDLSAHFAGRCHDISGLFAGDLLDEARQYAAGAVARIALSDLSFLPVVARTDARMFALGWSYKEHQLETNKDAPAFPNMFSKLPQSLVVIGGYARGAMRRDPTQVQVREAQLLLELIERGWGRDNPAVRQVLTSQFIPDGSPEQVQWFNELERWSTSAEHAARIVAAFGHIDVSEWAAAITCPTRVLHARGDARVPFEEGRRTAGLIPGARCVPLDSRNHALLQGEAAFSSCFEEIQDFLDEHQAAPPPALHDTVPTVRQLWRPIRNWLLRCWRSECRRAERPDRVVPCY